MCLVMLFFFLRKKKGGEIIDGVYTRIINTVIKDHCCNPI